MTTVGSLCCKFSGAVVLEGTGVFLADAIRFQIYSYFELE